MSGISRFTNPINATENSAARRVAIGCCILHVEDNEEHREKLRSCLDESYQVIEAAHGSQGLALAREYIPDLIITEVMLPYMDGFSLCHAVKTDGALKHIPVVLTTSLEALEYQIQGLEAGADSILLKPFDCELILAQIKSLLKNRFHVQSHYSRKVYVEPTRVPLPEKEDEFLRRAKGIVEAEMSDANFNLSIFSERMHRCERQLQRKFKSILGMTPMEYVRVMRLKRAVQLIENKVGNISEIAFKVGFKNPRHFTTSFRKQFNISPKEYMKTTKTSHKAT